MSQKVTAEELFLRLFEVAIKTLWKEHGRHAELADNAANMAREMMPYVCLIPGVSIVGGASAIAAAPVQNPGLPPDLTPHVHAQTTTLVSAPMGQGAARFGHAFSGWPENELVLCLAAIQEIVLGRQFGASDEQAAASQTNLQNAIAQLTTARVSATIRKA